MPRPPRYRVSPSERWIIRLVVLVTVVAGVLSAWAWWLILRHVGVW